MQVNLNLSIPPETIPTLISLDKLNELIQGDEKPYYVIEEILDITEPAKGVEFTREFWLSYLSKLKDAPFPGSKSGHTSPYAWWETGDMDIFTIGGEIKGNSVYLKMYIPRQGYKSSNETLIKATKTGMVHFSIVAWTEDLIEVDEFGDVTSIKAIRSVKGERNDVAERDMGAMPQRVNKNGNENPDNNKEEDINIMPDKTYKEAITLLKNRCGTGELSFNTIGKDLGFEIMTKEHKEAIETLEKVKKLTGENPVEQIKAMKAQEQQVKQDLYYNMRERLMRDEFGSNEIEVQGKKEVNLKREAAEPYVSKEIQTEEELKQQIEDVKKNPVVENISFQIADVNSNVNDLTGIKTNTSGTEKFRSETIKI
jgi:hypothetical protein